MAHNFISSDTDQMYLLPPDMRDQLPGNHLLWFIMEAVSHFDLTSFYQRYNPKGEAMNCHLNIPREGRLCRLKETQGHLRKEKGQKTLKHQAKLEERKAQKESTGKKKRGRKPSG